MVTPTKRPRLSEACTPSAHDVVNADVRGHVESSVFSWRSDVDCQPADDENILRLFDVDPRFGPCRGLTRTERLHRARAIGLRPNPVFEDLLTKLPKNDFSVYDVHCLRYCSS
jgi:hypothetical protein